MTTPSGTLDAAFPIHGISSEPPAALFGQFALEGISPRRDLDDIPHRHSFTEFLFVTAGRGTHVVDFVPYEIEPNQVYLLAQGQVHHWEEAEGLDGVLVLFKEDFPRWAADTPAGITDLPTFGTPAMKATVEQASRVKRLLAAMTDEYALDGAHQAFAMRSLLTSLLVETSRMTAQEAASTRSALVRGFLRAATRKISADTTVGGCAALLGVSPGHLHAVVLEETGRTPGEFLRSTLAREAARLLMGSELSGAQIAVRLGFSSPSYFTRFFQREHGHKPTAFRRMGRSAALSARAY